MVQIRTPLTCETILGICRNCYGSDLGTAKRINLGVAVGIMAGQAIGEPGTQMILRTFHTGGGGITLGYKARSIVSPSTGLVVYNHIVGTLTVRAVDGIHGLVLKEEGSLMIESKHSKMQLTFPGGAIIFLPNFSFVTRGKVMVDFCVAKTFRSKFQRWVQSSWKVKKTQLPQKIVQKRLLQSGELYFCTHYVYPKLALFISTSSKYNSTKRNAVLTDSDTEETLNRTAISQKLRGDYVSLWILRGVKYCINSVATVLKPEKSFLRTIPIACLPLSAQTYGVTPELNASSPGFVNINFLTCPTNLLIKESYVNFCIENCKVYIYERTKKIMLKFHISNDQILKKDHVVFTPSYPFKAPYDGLIYEVHEKFLLLVAEERHYLRSTNSLYPAYAGQKGGKNRNFILRAGSRICDRITMRQNGVLEINFRKVIVTIKPCRLYHKKFRTTRIPRNKIQNPSPFETEKHKKVLEYQKVSFIQRSPLIEGQTYLLDRFSVRYDLTTTRFTGLYSHLITLSPNFNLTKVPVMSIKHSIVYKSGERVFADDLLVNTQIFLLNDSRDKLLNNLVISLGVKLQICCYDIKFKPLVDCLLLQTLVYSSTHLSQVIFSLKKFQVLTCEYIKILVLSYNSLYFSDQVTLKRFLSPNKFVLSETVVGELNLRPFPSGQILQLKELPHYFSVVTIRTCDIECFLYWGSHERIYVIEGDFITTGTRLTTKLTATCTGRIHHITKTRIFIRQGMSRLFFGTHKVSPFLHDEVNFVKKGLLLATALSEQYSIKDITQGIKEISRMLEVRKDFSLGILMPFTGKIQFCSPYLRILTPSRSIWRLYLPNFQNKLLNGIYDGKFVKRLQPLTTDFVTLRGRLASIYYYYVHGERFESRAACEEGLRYIRLYLTEQIKVIYLEYGIDIAYKNLELITRCMTSKVTILATGATSLMVGETIDFNKVKQLENYCVKLRVKQPQYTPLPRYEPTIFGLTKTALRSESFLSAASFQSTIKVLTSAAVQGKKDWFTGLKESVIAARAIPRYQDRIKLTLQRPMREVRSTFHVRRSL